MHLISKLTKEVRKLKNRKGAEKAVEKAKRKAERLLLEIGVIKVRLNKSLHVDFTAIIN